VPFVQKILREISCPRCNAIAQERLEDRDNAVVIQLVCPKCKLKRNLGITTRKALKLKKRQKKLRESLSRAKNQRDRSNIQKKIEFLEREINLSETGI